MQEWQNAVQKLIDHIEEHACENPSLSEISAQVGYSPYYCSEQFHRFAGMTIREYMLKRRLSMATAELRDTGVPIINIALKYGFSDQSTFTRAFKNVFGCTPLAYRKDPNPLGFEWNEEVCQDYQRHYPEILGYQVLRPVKKLG